MWRDKNPNIVWNATIKEDQKFGPILLNSCSEIKGIFNHQHLQRNLTFLNNLESMKQRGRKRPKCPTEVWARQGRRNRVCVYLCSYCTRAGEEREKLDTWREGICGRCPALWVKRPTTGDGTGRSTASCRDTETNQNGSWKLKRIKWGRKPREADRSLCEEKL